MQSLSDFLRFRECCPFCKGQLCISWNNEYRTTSLNDWPIDIQSPIYRKTFVKDFTVGCQINNEDGYCTIYLVEEGHKKQLSGAKYNILQEYLKNKKQQELEIYCFECYYHLISLIQIDLEKQKIILGDDVREVFDVFDPNMSIDVEIENSLINKISTIWKNGHGIQIDNTYLDPTNLEKLKKDLQMLLLFQ